KISSDGCLKKEQMVVSAIASTPHFTVKPDGASDKAISVHSSDPQTASVTLSGLVATVKGVKQGSVSIVGMTSDGEFVAVAAVTVSAP
ncbi:Ig-like domain-containing protein, partial [Shigella boydii]